MSKKYQLTENEYQAIHSLNDSELERLHKQISEEIVRITNEATATFNKANKPGDAMERLLFAAKGFTISTEVESRLRAMNVEAFNELNRRDLHKKRQENNSPQ